jgi:hypothetical protein
VHEGSTYEWQHFLAKKKESVIAPVGRWRAPPKKFVKINTDATFMEQARNGGWRAICRNSDADVCIASVRAPMHAKDG